MIGRERIFEILQGVLASSEADQTEAVFIGNQTSLTRFANNSVHQNVAERDTDIIFRVALGKKIGVASSNSLHKERLMGALREAVKIARHQVENPHFSSLPSPGEYKRIKTFFEETANFTAEDRAEKVKGIFNRVEDKGLKVAGAFSTGEGEIAVLNSLGLAAHQPLSAVTLRMVVSSEDSSGYADFLSRDINELNVDELAEVAIRKCLDSKGPRDLKPGKYDVLLEPPAVGELMEWMSMIGFGARSIQEETSFLSGRLGDKIMSEKVTIYDDGSDPSGIAMPFDFEGVPKQRVYFLHKGVAEGVVYDSMTANREGKASTGHALPPSSRSGPMPLNIFVEPGEGEEEEMSASMERGILVTRFHYVNGLLNTREALFTGMTRDGTFFIEDGEVRYPIENLRFTESMLRAFSNVHMISKKRKAIKAWWEKVGAAVVPAFLIRAFNFSGKTE